MTKINLLEVCLETAINETGIDICFLPRKLQYFQRAHETYLDFNFDHYGGK